MTLERGTRARLTAAFVLLLVLGSGVVLGVALDRQLEARTASGREFRRPPVRSGMDPRGRGFEPRSGDSSRGPSEPRDSARGRPDLIVDLVGLSDVQKAQTDSIYWHYQGQMRALHEEFDSAYSSRYREIMSESREAMISILSAEQRVVYDSLLVDWNRRRQERRQDSVPPTGSDRGQR